MDVGADGMSGAVNEIIRVTFLLDVAARRAIHFPARNAAARAHRVEYSLYPGIARVPHDLEHFDHAARWSRTQKTHPGNVIVNRPRSILLPPHVKQDEVALANGNRTIGARLVVRVAGVGVHRHDGPVIGDKVLPAKRFHEPLLYFVLGGSTVACPPPNFPEGLCHNGIHAVARGKVTLDLLVAPRG